MGTIQTSLEVALVSLFDFTYLGFLILNKIKIFELSYQLSYIGLICYLKNSTLSNYFFSVINKVLRKRLVLIFWGFFYLKIIINN